MTHLTRMTYLAAAVSALLLFAGCAALPAPGAADENVPAVAPAGPVALETPVTSEAPLIESPLPQPPVSPQPLPEAAESTVVEPPVPPLPRARLDPLQDAERVQLWQRLRAGFRLPDMDGDLVDKWEQWYAGDPAYVRRMAERGGRYLFHVVEEVQRRGLPTELALLPFIESAFNPQALSRAAASGMWQFMPGTGKDFELVQNVFRDDRRDVLASTRAALEYLQQLHGMFDDWPLALAAYNWGQGNVQRAIERNRRAGLATDFESLGRLMPQETREYVPKLQAVKNIIARPEDYGLSLPKLGDQPYFLSVPIERDIDVALVARLSGLSLDEFRQLNPQLNKPLILAAGTPQVLLPYDNANQFIRSVGVHDGPLASWTAWVAPRSLSTAQAARMLDMSEAQLRELNHIPPRMLITRGSTLLVPRAAQAPDVAEHIADNGTLLLAPDMPPLRRVILKAGRLGDSLVAVAKRYRVDAGQLAQWNGMARGGRFKAGQRIVVMLPAATGQPTRGRANVVKGKSTKTTGARSKVAMPASPAVKGALVPRSRGLGGKAR